MASNFPKLPGYVPTHDPTLVDHKKVSHIKLEQIRNAKNVVVPLYALPRPVERNFLPEKNEQSKSVSHTQFPNYTENDINELYEPTFVKLDKQVSSFSYFTLGPFGYIFHRFTKFIFLIIILIGLSAFNPITDHLNFRSSDSSATSKRVSSRAALRTTASASSSSTISLRTAQSRSPSLKLSTVELLKVLS